MKVALFAHNFLEPTHHAIAQILSRMEACHYWIFAKRLTDQEFFKIPTVVSRTYYHKGPLQSLTKSGFDLVHAIYDGDIALRAAGLAKDAAIPFILSFHGGFDTKAKIYDPMYKQITKLVAEDAAAVTVVSGSDEIRLRSIGVERHIDVMPVPIDMAIVPSAEGADLNSLVAVGRFVPKKGFDVAIKALALLPEIYTLSIIGDGILREDLKALAESLNISDRIRWYGMQSLETTLEIVAGSGMVLHPSRVAEDGNADGTPQMILWAQAVGIPVISTPTGAIQDIITNDETGVLVDSDNPKKLAEAILQLRHDDSRRSRIMTRAQKTVLERHSLTGLSLRWQDLYRRAASSLNR